MTRTLHISPTRERMHFLMRQFMQDHSPAEIERVFANNVVMTNGDVYTFRELGSGEWLYGIQVDRVVIDKGMRGNVPERAYQMLHELLPTRVRPTTKER